MIRQFWTDSEVGTLQHKILPLAEGCSLAGEAHQDSAFQFFWSEEQQKLPTNWFRVVPKIPDQAHGGERSGAEHASKAYRIVKQIPSDSSGDDVSGSDDEWLPAKRELANGSSSDSETEDAEEDEG
ncbi:hypothetical protein PAMP_000937 [Pampus punctatissimus]